MPEKGGTPRPMAMRDFMRRVVKKEEWRDHITNLGLIEASEGRGQRTPMKGLRLAEVQEAPDWEDAA